MNEKEENKGNSPDTEYPKYIVVFPVEDVLNGEDLEKTLQKIGEIVKI
jgi:hypothetical protein